MKRLLGIIAIAAAACGPADPRPATPAGPAVCEQGPQAPSALVGEESHVVGATLNVLRRFGDDLWVTESGANTVSRLRRGGDFAVHTDVGNERGPTDLWVGEDHVWITNFVANSVTVSDRATGEVVTEISDGAFDAPAGIAGTDRWVFVGNTEFHGDEDYGPGSVTVIDRATFEVVGRRATAAPNPQYLRAIGDDVVVVDSGSLRFDDGRFVPDSDAAIERLDGTTEDPLRATASVALLPVGEGTGSPGYPAHDEAGGKLYLASGTTPDVVSLDFDTMTWERGGGDPIRLYDSTENALHDARMGPDGLLFVTAFNRDELYLIDTRCDTVLGDPISLDASELLAGPLGVVPFGTDDGIEAWVGMSLANELRSVQLHLSR